MKQMIKFLSQKSNSIFFKCTLVLVLIIGELIYNYAQTSILDGYTDKLSYRAGEEVTFYINATNVGMIDIDLFSIDNACPILTIPSIDVRSQSTKTSESWQDGFGYAPSNKKWLIPSNLQSGFYLIKTKTKRFPLIPIIIKIENKSKAEIVIVCPTNTDAAYNKSGGEKNLYPNKGDSTVGPVSFRRPAIDKANQDDFYSGFLKWFNSTNYFNLYNVNVIADTDMDDYSEIESAKLLIVIGHSEYWTRQARLNFDRFVDEGNDAIVLSGNTMYQQVRYRIDPSNTDNPQLVCYKGNDPECDPLLSTSNNWNEISSLKYPTISSIGSDSWHGGFQGEKPGLIYNGFNGHKIILNNSPLLAGTGLNYGDIIPKSKITPISELDGTLILNANPVDGNIVNNADPIINLRALGFFKAEIIAYDKTTMLSSLYSPFMQKTAYSPIMAFQKTCSSGKIINVNTNEWCTADKIFNEGANQDKIRLITTNMINLLMGDYNIFTSSTPSSFSICATP